MTIEIESHAPTKAHKHPNYFVIFIILAVITGAMTAIELLHLDITRSLQNTIFLTLSIIKAILVAMYYMHLKMDSRFYTGLFALPLFLVLILVIILLI
jgi:caa(3)-type oxidase subunit IV